MDVLLVLMGIAAASAAGAWVRHRLAVRRGMRPELDDAVVRQIEEQGWADVDEPLDWEEIRAEEERFWGEESWRESSESWESEEW